MNATWAWFGKFLDYAWSCQVCSKLDNHGLPCQQLCLLKSNDDCNLWMQSRDTKVQCKVWRKLEVIALKKGITNLNFKGFMANNVQVNWNAIWIIYGTRDLVVKIVDNEQTFFFHWTQSLERHTKQLVAPSSKICTMPSARNIRSQHPWRRRTFGMLHFDLGGTLSKLPTTAQFTSSTTGWTFSTSMSMGRIHVTFFHTALWIHCVVNL